MITADQLLQIALRGDGDEWERLQELCADRPTAERLARALEQSASLQSETAKSWAVVLEEMHDGLKVNLPVAPPTAG
ncbi:MAG: hypothetical protein HZA93_08465 [Verrucomicrobia bacterium]|nr:hypothetical protein [Verrucomicrobiota bacterium]